MQEALNEKRKIAGIDEIDFNVVKNLEDLI
jgi:hypothetical protein